MKFILKFLEIAGKRRIWLIDNVAPPPVEASVPSASKNEKSLGNGTIYPDTAKMKGLSFIFSCFEFTN
jgi:hypothetical protein